MTIDYGTETREIVALLTDRLEALLDDLKPGWRRRGHDAILSWKAKGVPGSWRVHLTRNRGLWVRHSRSGSGPNGGLGGGPMELIAYVRSDEASTRPTRDDYDWARRFLGLPGWEERTEADRQAARQRAAEAAARREAQLREAEAAAQRECARAAEIWRGAAASRGTLVETWLEARSIDLVAISWPLPTIRYLADHPYWFVEDDDALPIKVHSGPAMVAATQNGKTNRLQGVHLTWFTADGTAKAEIFAPDGSPLPARKIRGALNGGHVRFCPAPADGSPLLLAEGIETTASAIEASGIGGWACLSLSNFSASVPADAVLLAFDGDEADPDQARKAKEAATKAHASAGRTVRAVQAADGFDFNSWMAAVKRQEPGKADGRATETKQVEFAS
mgnify:CR=1 FL=1|tara:strand:- start:848 stop:2020 length:1173 start_codon:yes stop_codon:yes gene_type:complete